MTALSNIEMLRLWDRGHELHPLDRGLLALQAVAPEASWEELANWPLGLRNRKLFDLRTDCFGPSMSAWVACPECGEKLEIELDAREMVAGAEGQTELPGHNRTSSAPDGANLSPIRTQGVRPGLLSGAPTGLSEAARNANNLRECSTEQVGARPKSVETSLRPHVGTPADASVCATKPGRVVAIGEEFRLPTTRDLAMAAREQDPRRATLRLLESCRVGAAMPAREWSGEEIEEIGERLAAADPMAETTLSLECAACGHAWDEPFDVTAFLWTEMETQVRRLLWEVHVLASAYCWSEAEILALSDRRRAIYLEMARS